MTAALFMSHLITNLCKGLVLPAPSKNSLLCLADSADDEGRVWEGMSVALVCSWTCFGRATVIRALAHLEEVELLLVSRANGRRNRSRLNVDRLHAMNQSQADTGNRSRSETGDQSRADTGPAAPVSERDGTSLTLIPVPVSQRDPIPYVPISNKEVRDDRSAPKRRISEQWSPDAKLRTWVQERRPDVFARLDDVVQNFRDHYLAKGEARASWSASFRTWVQREGQYARGGSARHGNFSAVDYRAGLSADGRLL